MSQLTLRFIADQAAPGVVFTPAVGPEFMTPGNLAGWSSASFKPSASNRRADLEDDGGHWIGTVHMLPDHVVYMSATWFPVKGELDSIQISGPLQMAARESALAILGGTGKYAGAFGEARMVLAMSDQDTPIYRYELRVSL